MSVLFEAIHHLKIILKCKTRCDFFQKRAAVENQLLKVCNIGLFAKLVDLHLGETVFDHYFHCQFYYKARNVSKLYLYVHLTVQDSDRCSSSCVTFFLYHEAFS